MRINTTFYVLVLVFSTLAHSEADYMPFLSSGVTKVNKYNPEKSNWVGTFGFEAAGLPVERNFKGQDKTLKDKNELITGVKLGVGREFYLGKGFATKTQIEGYFLGTLFEPKKSLNKNESNVEGSFTKKEGNMWGGEISQSLSYIKEFYSPSFLSDHKVKMYFEPFLEGGIGLGKSFYRFDYVKRSSVTNEEYRSVVDNTFLSQRLSVGVNLTSKEGYFLSLKASQFSQSVSNSKSYEMSKINGSRNSEDLDHKNINLSYSYYLGGGYKW